MYICNVFTRNTQKFNLTTTTMTTTTINKNFKIKAFGLNNEGKKINTLVGVSGLVNLIGEELANKFVARAFDSMEDKCVCKLRRGLKITFYVF